jgi:hypothetical protein
MSAAWGGATKVYTASRNMYETVVAECDELFPRMLDAFHLAAAIGIAEGKRKTFSRQGPEIFNMYSVDPEGVLEPLLMSLYPDASATDRYQMLLEFAEYGIEIIFDEVTQTATFDPTPYVSSELTRGTEAAQSVS